MRRFLIVLTAAVLQLAGCSGSPSAVQTKMSTTIPPTGESTAGTSADSDSGASEAHLSRKQLIEKIRNLREEAFRQLATNQMAAAADLFRECGGIAENFCQRFSDLEPSESELLGDVFYNQACALAKISDTPAAMSALDRAVRAGWNDLGHVDRDSDLESVRQLPEFTIKRQEWELYIANKPARVAAAEIAGFQSYPFNFTLPDLDSKIVKLADYRGKVVILDIWGTGRDACRGEIPLYIKLQTIYGDQGLQFVGVNYEGSKTVKEAVKQIREFRDSMGMNYPCLIGDSKTRDQVPGFRVYPTTLFLDRMGKVRMQFVGAHPYDRLESIVKILLNEPEK